MSMSSNSVGVSVTLRLEAVKEIIAIRRVENADRIPPLWGLGGNPSFGFGGGL